MTLIKWKNRSSEFIARRYDILAPIYPIFSLFLMLPRGIRKKAVEALKLKKGDRVLEIGCGTGRNLGLLRTAVGNQGKVYGIDLSERMLQRAQSIIKQNNWTNVELVQGDAEGYTTPEPPNAVLFSLSYCVMPHRIEILSNTWQQLRKGGRIIIMDAQFPNGIMGKIMVPFKPMITLFLKASILGNPYIKPIEELKEVTSIGVVVKEISMKSYFIATAEK